MIPSLSCSLEATLNNGYVRHALLQHPYACDFVRSNSSDITPDGSVSDSQTPWIARLSADGIRYLAEAMNP